MLFVCLSACLLACLPACLFVCLFVHAQDKEKLIKAATAKIDHDQAAKHGKQLATILKKELCALPVRSNK